MNSEINQNDLKELAEALVRISNVAISTVEAMEILVATIKTFQEK